MNAGIARTTKDTPRAEAQRERILCAAQRCFIEYGFHAASMASIAETAQMSAGLMYRYFENKSAIVLAIIERQLQEGRTQIAQLHSSSELAAALHGPDIVRDCPLVLLGSPALTERYAQALGLVGHPPDAILNNTAPEGLWQVALSAGLVSHMEISRAH